MFRIYDSILCFAVYGFEFSVQCLGFMVYGFRV